MAGKVSWSHEAAADLEGLAEYIARDSAFYAAAVVQEIIEASRSLIDFPKIGRVVPELGNPNIRELFIREYRLIYHVEKHGVVILGLIHGKRDLKSLWEIENRY